MQNKKVSINLNPKLSRLPGRQKIMEYLILFLVSLTHLLLFSLWTSPFYRYWYGCDASFFTLVGRGITEGKVPYRDFFDLKGPYFFFIEALGQLMAKERLGAFLIQIPFAFASIALIYEICLLFISKKKSIIVIAFYLLGFITTLWGGNTAEEFALPFSLLALYLYLKAVHTDGLSIDELPSWMYMLFGGIFSFCLFSKIIMSAPVLGIIASVIFYDLVKKNFKHLFISLVYILCGMAIVFFPLIVYFGINNSLNDMLHCVFVLGFSRSTDYYERFNITWELKLSGCIFAFVFAILHRDKITRDIGIALMAMSSATYLLLHLGTPYYYYFTTVYPCLTLALILFIKIYFPDGAAANYIYTNVIPDKDYSSYSNMSMNSSKQTDAVDKYRNAHTKFGGAFTISLCLILLYLFYYVPSGLDTVRTVLYNQNDDYSDFYNSCNEMAALIPECDRDSVFSLMLDMQWFEATQITPCCRYVVNLPFFIALDPPILDDLLNMYENTPPKWMVLGNGVEDNLPDIYPVIIQKYECVFENSSGKLYLLQ